MKSLIALCFLAAICAMQASAYDPLDELKDRVESIKRNVVSTIANLGDTRNKLIITAKQNMDTIRKRSTAKASCNRPSMKFAVDQAKAEGKDAEHCYTTIQDSLHNIVGKTFSGLRMCNANGERMLQQAFSPLDAGMATGWAFIPQLDKIFPECYQSNTPQMQTCIIKKMNLMNDSIRYYQMLANKWRVNAQSGLNNATDTLSSCVMGPELAAGSAINDLRIAANRCITN